MTGRRLARLIRYRRHAQRHGAPTWAVALALLGFALRTLIPIGFEPAHGSLSVVLCHEGFPAGFFSHRRRTALQTHGVGGSRHDAHCAYCNGTSPAPAFSLASLVRTAPVAIGVVSFLESSAPSVRLAHVPQARGPPHLA